MEMRCDGKAHCKDSSDESKCDILDHGIGYDKQIVPVEVQRPGMRYKYPDDVWYQQLRTGKIVNADGVELLSKQGFSLEDVERAIRHLFLKIALPFSPHKSANVRFAEIADILKRFDAFRHKPRPSERARTL